MALAAADASADRITCHGLTLPSGSKKIEAESKECRYVSSMNWSETVRFFNHALPSAHTRWHREVNIPAAKYVHVENMNKKSGWEGVNIYTLGGDSAQEVRVFVIPRPEEPKPPAAAAATDKKPDEKSKKTAGKKKKKKK